MRFKIDVQKKRKPRLSIRTNIRRLPAIKSGNESTMRVVVELNIKMVSVIK